MKPKIDEVHYNHQQIETKKFENSLAIIRLKKKHELTHQIESLFQYNYKVPKSQNKRTFTGLQISKWAECKGLLK